MADYPQSFLGAFVQSYQQAVAARDQKKQRDQQYALESARVASQEASAQRAAQINEERVQASMQHWQDMANTAADKGELERLKLQERTKMDAFTQVYKQGVLGLRSDKQRMEAFEKLTDPKVGWSTEEARKIIDGIAQSGGTTGQDAGAPRSPITGKDVFGGNFGIPLGQSPGAQAKRTLDAANAELAGSRSLLDKAQAIRVGEQAKVYTAQAALEIVKTDTAKQLLKELPEKQRDDHLFKQAEIRQRNAMTGVDHMRAYLLQEEAYTQVYKKHFEKIKAESAAFNEQIDKEFKAVGLGGMTPSQRGNVQRQLNSQSESLTKAIEVSKRHMHSAQLAAITAQNMMKMKLPDQSDKDYQKWAAAKNEAGAKAEIYHQAANDELLTTQTLEAERAKVQDKLSQFNQVTSGSGKPSAPLTDKMRNAAGAASGAAEQSAKDMKAEVDRANAEIGETTGKAAIESKKKQADNLKVMAVPPPGTRGAYAPKHTPAKKKKPVVTGNGYSLTPK